LLVLGGAVAGTATAWVLSTATASADTPDFDTLSAVTAGVTQHSQDTVLPTQLKVAVTPVVEPTAKAVEDIDQALRAQQEQARAATAPQLDEVADGIRDAFGQMGTWFEPRWSEVLDPNALLVVGKSTNRVADSASTNHAPFSHGTPVVDNPATSFAELGDQWALQPAQPLVALPDDLRSTLPGDPSSLPLTPFAPPASVPVHCGCGGDGSGSAGSQNAASQAAFVNAYNSAVARALKPTTERISVRPGKQPGSTPD
jgi:hypothetical protein